MTTAGRPVSEDDLHGYVDGFLTAEDRARVDAYLRDHPDVARRVEDWQEGNAALQRALAGKAAEPVPSRLNLARLAQARQARSWRPPQIAASLLLSLAVGGAGGWWARGSDIPHGLANLSRQAAVAQRVFGIAGPVQRVDFGAGAADQQLGWSEGLDKRPVRAPDLSAAGYRLVGGRLVATEQGSAVLFLYQGQHGEQIGLFARLMIGIDENAPLRAVSTGGVSGYAWARDGIGFSLTSAAPNPALRTLSDQVRTAMAVGS